MQNADQMTKLSCTFRNFQTIKESTSQISANIEYRFTLEMQKCLNVRFVHLKQSIKVT